MQGSEPDMAAGWGGDPIALGLLAYFGLFFLLAFFWPTWRLWKRYGTNALVLPRDDSAQGVVGRWFRLTLLAIPVALIAISLGAPPDSLGRFAWIEGGALRTIGWTILASSLLWIIAAQARMGASWRIGIDAAAQPPLVTTGLFALSRNPIFLGMRLALLGLFLVLPTAATLAILLLGEALIQIQVRLEEAHLAEALGPQYEAYRRATRRWLGRAAASARLESGPGGRGRDSGSSQFLSAAPCDGDHPTPFASVQ